MAALMYHVFLKRTHCKHTICVIWGRHVIVAAAVSSSRNVNWGIWAWKNRHYLTIPLYRTEHRMVRQLCRPFVANRSLAVSRFHFPNNWNNFEILYSVWKITAYRMDDWGSIFDGGKIFFQVLHRTVILVRITPSLFPSCLCSWKMGVK
jgi:hypothetical protein